MSYRDDIRSALTGDASVAQIVAGRIYWLRAPAQIVPPYVVLYVVTEIPHAHLRGNTALTRIRLQVSMFGESYTELQRLDEAVRDALEIAPQFSSLHVLHTEAFEDDTRLYHLVSQFSIHHPS